MPSSQKAENQLIEVEKAINEGGLEGCAQKVSKGKGVLNYIFARLLKRYDTLVLEKRELAQRRKEVSGLDLNASGDAVTKFLIAQTELSEFRDELLMTIDDSSRSYVTRFLPVLNTVGNIAPLLGLLGTITGMIKAFESIAEAGTGDPKVVAGGISEALITTATGLIIAIPAIIFYRYLGSKADSSRTSIEVYAISFSNTLLAILEKQ
ncbi:MAG: MotA/TolQ/ExbB proton channel family protein [Candidatus Latescibacteria bacterium]|nr:MotA/TolQ/ExbB proton channel family protein [Candidatus Latescibacterota bacterium]